MAVFFLSTTRQHYTILLIYLLLCQFSNQSTIILCICLKYWCVGLEFICEQNTMQWLIIVVYDTYVKHDPAILQQVFQFDFADENVRKWNWIVLPTVFLLY